MSQLLIDDLIPIKTPKSHYTNPLHSKVISILALCLFMGSLIFEIAEITNIDNTINGTKLFWKYGIIGLVVASLLGWLIPIKYEEIKYSSNLRFTFYFSIFIGFFLLAPALASFINHKYAKPGGFATIYKINSKGTDSKNSEFYIFVNVKDGEERFVVDKELYHTLPEDGLVKFITKHGTLGYDYVDHFELITN